MALAAIEISLPAVILLVGPAAAGKTSLRHRLIDAGLDSSLVVSLDDTRLWLQERSLAAGRPRWPLSRHTPVALKIAGAQSRSLLDASRGYLSDNTNLRRPERRAQIAAGHAAGLPVVALLLAPVSLEVLSARNAGRPPEEVVPEPILAAQHRRHHRLTTARLSEEGFDAVWSVEPGSVLTVSHRTDR